MSRFYGKVGFSETVDKGDGIWASDEITEIDVVGDLIQETIRSVPNEHLNDDIKLTNRVSLISDETLLRNFQSLKYVKWMGVAWVVQSVEVKRPRLILSLGGVYNGPTKESE